MQGVVDVRAEAVSDRISLTGTTIVTRLADGGDLRPGEAPLILDHPAVSRRHARLSSRGRAMVLEDAGSSNGTFVNRERLAAPRELQPNDLIQIGPFRMLFDGHTLLRLSHGNHAALRLQDVVKDVRRGTGETERILQSVTLEARPGRVMCVIGASGSGKSTLLNIMSGRALPSGGRVSVGNLDLHQQFSALKQELAYLPQSEIVHESLTLRQALTYAARLRLPRKTAASTCFSAVTEAMESVGLLHRADVRIGQLSGGQRKRASLACEILGRPAFLFVDEATSGLDEVTDREIMALLKRLAREGMAVVCVTHTLANLADYCDDLVVLAPGGRLACVAAPRDVLRHFQSDSLGDVLATISEAAPSRRSQPPPQPQRPLDGQQSMTAKDQRRKAPHPLDVLHQLNVLIRRNVVLLVQDRRTLVLAAAQSLLIGLLLGYSFVSFGDVAQADQSARVSLLLLCITSLWMGCNTASKEIVGEWHIFTREHDINVMTFTFVLGKFLVTAAFAALQVALLLGVTTILIDRVAGGVLPQLLNLLAAAISGVTSGLLISSLCRTRDQASVIVPLAVAPQLILGGGLAPALPELATLAAKLSTGAYHVRLMMQSDAALSLEGSGGGVWALFWQIVVMLLVTLGITAARSRR